MSSSGILALLSDFGTRGHYVAAMKGVALSVAPSAHIVDLSHDVPAHDVREGAQTLQLAAREFPAGTVFVAVVDPGVGTERLGIAVRTKDGSSWVGPDNGLLWPSVCERGVETVRLLENPSFARPGARSSTFHGRDLFAPAGACLVLGVEISALGRAVDSMVQLELPGAEVRDGVLRASVLRVDEFGNVITSALAAHVHELGGAVGAGAFSVRRGGDELARFPYLATYGSASEPCAPLSLIESTGNLELALNQASAAEQFRLAAGDALELSWEPGA